MSVDTTIQSTLAFVFNQDLSEVVLIKKERPIHHAGLLNGLGGKLEADETHLECVVREIEEEAEIKIDTNHWRRVGNISWAEWRVSIWTAVFEEEKPTTFSDPNVQWVPVANLPKNLIENLRWLIPLCIDVHQKVRSSEESLPSVDVVYS